MGPVGKAYAALVAAGELKPDSGPGARGRTRSTASPRTSVEAAPDF